MRVHMSDNLGDWIGKMEHAAERAEVELPRAVENNAKYGRDAAKTFARRTAGAHGKHYYQRIDAEQIAPRVWEYGPSGHPQGEMSFEWGSRNQKPHRDLARSADIVGPALARDTQRLASKWLT